MLGRFVRYFRLKLHVSLLRVVWGTENMCAQWAQHFQNQLSTPRLPFVSEC